jgi:hypothetical protein
LEFPSGAFECDRLVLSLRQEAVTTHSTASEEADVFRRVATVFAFLRVESGDQCLTGDEFFQLDGEDTAEEGWAELKDLLILWQSVDHFPRLAADTAEVDESLKI